MIRLQLYLILSKRSLIFILLFSLTIAAIILYNSDFLSGYSVLDANRVENSKQYLDNSLQVIKLLSVLISLFLFIQAFSKEARLYASYLVDGIRSKLIFFLTKIQAIFLIVFLFVMQQMWLFFLIGRVLTPYTLDFLELSILFGKICFQAMFFGMIQSMLVQTLKHNFSLIFPLVLYWFMETHPTRASVESSRILQQINMIVPNLLSKDSGWDLYLPIEEYAFVFMGIALICCLVHLYQDI